MGRHFGVAAGLLLGLGLVARAPARAEDFGTLGGKGGLRGKISLPDGRPGVGAEVRIAAPARDLIAVKVDEKGSFTKSGLPSGALLVSVRCPRCATWTGRVVVPADGVGVLDRTLEAAPLVTGRAVDGRGAPIAGAEVRPVLHETVLPTSLYPMMADPDVATATDAEGRFSIDGLRASRIYVIRFIHLHFAMLETPEMTFEATTPTDVPVTLEDAGWMSGSVVDGTGKPISGASVHGAEGFIWEEGEAADRRTPYDPATQGPVVGSVGRTGADGRFTLGSFLPKSYVLTVRATGFEDQTLELPFVGGVEHEPIVVRMKPGTGTKPPGWWIGDEEDGHLLDTEGVRVQFALPSIPGLARNGTGGRLKREWRLRRERQKLWIFVNLYPRTMLPAVDPGDVAAEEALRLAPFDPATRSEGIQHREYVKGTRGAQASGILAGGQLTHPDYGPGEFMIFAGVLQENVFDVVVLRYGEVEPTIRGNLLKFLRTGIHVDTETYLPAWTDAKIARTWMDGLLTPAIGPADFGIALRTKHFVLLSDAQVPKEAGAALEETYELVKKMAPFEEASEPSLIAGFVFRSESQYRKFATSTRPQDAAENRNIGHSRTDCFTACMEPWDLRAIRHEAAHQIYRHRVGLFGGGSWLQEGLAEYAALTAEARRKFARAAVKAGSATPFRELVRMPSLLTEDTVASRARYEQAGSVVEFLRETYQPAKWPDLLHTVGVMSWVKPDEVLEAIRGIYGVEIEEIEAAWKDRWSH